jgi:hypothetical protein
MHNKHIEKKEFDCIDPINKVIPQDSTIPSTTTVSSTSTTIVLQPDKLIYLVPRYSMIMKIVTFNYILYHIHSYSTNTRIGESATTKPIIGEDIYTNVTKFERNS